MSRAHQAHLAGLRIGAIAAGLVCTIVVSPPLAAAGKPSVCRWQPIVNGLRHLRTAADLAAAESRCGVADPVDSSADTATSVALMGENLRTASQERAPEPHAQQAAADQLRATHAGQRD